ncbi:hypothetical protein E1A91_A04G087400v1 [Gossypium mustelinum]|uniref:Transcription repressor n=1 Tax=Gossypium mustelinum TaxID=34275 RepID=A0A5D2ZQ17_GOSMU|nr:hypothetical protein E1A91_A04G087400v1 [Gossypium mustelinum]
MGKKMKLPFLSNNNSVQAASSWSWPSCQQQPRTLSFRADVSATTPQSGFSTSSESPSCGCGYEFGGDPVETVVKGLRSDRLFFEPGESSSILEVTKPTSDDDDDGLPFKGSEVLSMESRDPFVDFSKCMEEMVEDQGLKDWEGLEKLLCWYLKANGKGNHGYIVAAFVDLLVKLAISSTDNCIPSCSNRSHSPSSLLSFYTSSSSSSSCSNSDDNSSTTTPCVSSLSDLKEIIEEANKKDVSSSSSLDV